MGVKAWKWLRGVGLRYTVTGEPRINRYAPNSMVEDGCALHRGISKGRKVHNAGESSC